MQLWGDRVVLTQWERKEKEGGGRTGWKEGGEERRDGEGLREGGKEKRMEGGRQADSLGELGGV